MGFAGHFAGTQKLECAVEQCLGISGRVCGDTGFAGDTETRVCSQSSVLGISERDSVVHVDVVSINAD